MKNKFQEMLFALQNKSLVTGIALENDFSEIFWDVTSNPEGVKLDVHHMMHGEMLVSLGTREDTQGFMIEFVLA